MTAILVHGGAGASESGRHERLRAGVRAVRPIVHVRVPASDGKLLSTLYRQGEVLEQAADGENLLVRVRVDAALRGRLEREGVVVKA